MREKDVLRLEVAVNHAGLVRAREATRDLLHEPGGLAVRERPAAAQPRAERLALDKIHGDVRHSVRDAEVEETRDVGALQGRGDLRLAGKARDDLGAHGHRRRDDLDGHGRG